MAEALGVAASVIQIIDAVTRLKELWDSVKNAPDDLVDCVHDIQRTARLLDKSKKLISSSTGISEDYLTECAQDLDDALAALRGVASDLQQGLQHNKRLGALRIVLKKDEIARGRRKLERAQSLLSTAQQNLALTLQLQHTSMLNQNHTLLLQVYSVVQTTTQNALADPDPSQISISGARSTVPHKLSDTQLGTCSSKSVSHRLREANSSYSIRFPHWLTRRCFEIVCRREMSSLQFTFTSYNVVETYSPGYIAALDGDLKQLKKLFETGQASFFDQSDLGDNLLQTAISGRQLDTAQFLITQCPLLGRKTEITFWMDWIHGLAAPCWIEDLALYFSDFSQTWGWLIRHIDIDEDMLSEFEHHFQAIGTSESWAEWLPLIYKAAYLGVHVLPHKARVWRAAHAISSGVFEHLTGTEISTQEVLELDFRHLCDHTVHSYTYLLENILRSVFFSDRDEPLEWSTVVREIFKFDKRQGFASHWLRSTMHYSFFDHGSPHYWYWKKKRAFSLPEIRNNQMQKVVQYLESMGVDLVHYGQRETHAIDEMITDQCGYWRALLCYGPRAVDWRLFFIPDGVEYEWAGGFWNWIENPELFFLPGTFPVGETDENQLSRDWMLKLDAEARECRRMDGIRRMKYNQVSKVTKHSNTNTHG